MIKKHIKLVIPIALLIGNAMIANGAIVPYSGNVGSDFFGYPTIDVYDPIGDVFFPPEAPPDAISGWDIERVVFYLSLSSDVLQIGIETVGIAGDAEGNGIDGNTALWLIELGGVDSPNLENSESMGVAFDWDQDGTYDMIAGVPSFDNTHQVCEFSGVPSMPFFAFGNELPAYDGCRFYTPLPESPNYELTLTSVLDYLIFEGEETCFDILAFGASLEDANISEEFVYGTVCIEDHEVTSIAVPDKFALTAYPNPFNPSTTVHFTLTEAGPVTLNVYNLAGHLVSTLVDGNLSVGEHKFVFNANELPSGLYIAQVNTTKVSQATRLLLLK